MRTFIKRDLAAPEHFFACEAAGLQWLSDVPAGARCVRVRGCHAAGLTLEYLESATPAVSAARAFGAGLARTHDAGAPGFGVPYLDTIIETYQGVHPLRPGWRERSSLHQLYPLLAHMVLFGAGYLRQTALAAHDAARIS